jgi:hypothetical protein
MNDPRDDRSGDAAQEVVAAQLGRRLRAPVDVVVRCPLGLPVVVEVPPLLDDGTPFPTRYWLSCPLAMKRVGRLESSGGVKRMEARSSLEAEFGERLAAAHQRYAAERDSLIPAGSVLAPSGGVGGAKTGVKCLHAHYADFKAGNDNPVGELVAPWVEPLDCQVVCVVDAEKNPSWREPGGRP